MRLLAVFPSRMDPAGIGAYVGSALGDDWNVTGVGSPGEDAAFLAEADAILVALADLTAEDIGRATKLAMIQTPSHGFDHVDIDAAADRGIPVCNVGTSGAEAGTVAEHAMLLMLACARRLIDGHDGLRTGTWPSLTASTIELQGKSLGIIGFGHIGREVAKRARAFGMDVLYYDPVPAHEDVEAELRLQPVPMEELLGRADVVTLHVPLMASTRGMIGKDELALMKDGAILVNTSRGPVVDNAAVADACNAGHITAGIDVFDPEPPPDDHPLRGAANVVLSPHVAGTTRESVQRIMAASLENLRRFERGERIKDIVNGVVPD